MNRRAAVVPAIVSPVVLTSSTGSPEFEPARWLCSVAEAETGRGVPADRAGEFTAGQPVLGVSGTLASTGQDSPAAGQVAAETGTSVDVDPTTGRIYHEVQSLAGHLTTERGERLVLSLSMSGATYPGVPTGPQNTDADVAAVAAAFQQAR